MAKHNPILDAARDEQARQEALTPKSSDELLAVKEALDVSSSRTASNIKELERGVQETAIATDIITSAINDVTSAQLISARAKGTANLQSQNATIDAFESGGGTDAQVTLISALKEDGDRLATLLDEKSDIVDDEHTGVQIIDNIINSFRSSQLDLEIQAAQNQESQSIRQIQNINAATEGFARINALTKKTLNSAVIQENYKAIEAEGRIKGAEVEIRNIHANASAMATLATADSRNVSSLLTAFRLEGEVAQRELQAERQVIAREQLEVQRKKLEIELPTAKARLQQLELQIADTKEPKRIAALEAQRDTVIKTFKDSLALEEQVVDSVMRAQSSAGIPIETKEIILRKFTNPASRKKYILLQELGSVEGNIIGRTPFDAKNNLSIIDESGVAQDTKGTDLLNLISNKQVEKYNTGTVKPPKDIETLTSDFNKTSDEIMTAFMADIKEGNPYVAPPFSVLEGKVSVTSTPLFQKVLKAMNFKETNPQKIMDATISGIFAKTITPEEGASGITAIFEAAATHNNTFQGGFRRVGLPNQVSYNTTLKRIPTFFETLKILPGLANPFTLPDKVLASEANTAGEFIASQVGAFVTTDLMDETAVQQAIVIILSTARPTTKEDQEKAKTDSGSTAASEALKTSIIGGGQ